MLKFKSSQLILLLFFMLTLGQAHPYAQVYQHFFNPKFCSCCQLKAKGCDRCKQFGHHNIQKVQKMHCHESKMTKTASLKDTPCNSTQKSMAQFVSDPFLLPLYQKPLKLSLIYAMQSLLPNPLIVPMEPADPPPKAKV